eukprot:26876-Eustigmatos_ZCMA.PRE.1
MHCSHEQHGRSVVFDRQCAASRWLWRSKRVRTTPARETRAVTVARDNTREARWASDREEGKKPTCEILLLFRLCSASLVYNTCKARTWFRCLSTK